MARPSLHKADVFFYILFSFLIGVALASIWPLGERVILYGILLSTAILAVSAYHRTFGISPDGIRKRKLGFLMGTLILVAMLGVYRYDHVNQTTGVLDDLAGLRVGKQNEVGVKFKYVGYVAGDPELVSGRQQFPMLVKRVQADERYIETRGLVLVTTQQFPKFEYGDHLQLDGFVERPVNYSDFDYITYLKRDGISYVASYPDLSKPDDPVKLNFFESIKLPAYQGIFRFKHAFEDSLERSIIEPHAAYLNGILTGTRKNIPQDLKEAFAITSTSHILAISGYNISVLAGALLAGLVWFVKRRTAFWISVGVIIAFVILTGASASVVRAGIMGLILLFANGFGRLYNSRNALAVAAVAMVLVNPLVLVFDVGFQLSFIAVMGILYGYPILNKLIRKGRTASTLWEIVLMTISAQIFVLPLLIYYFNQFSIVSLPANILVLPFVPFAMLFGFASGFAGLIWLPLGQALGWIAWAISNYELNVIQYFASIPYASISISINLATVIFLYALLAAVTMWATRKYLR